MLHTIRINCKYLSLPEENVYQLPRRIVKAIHWEVQCLALQAELLRFHLETFLDYAVCEMPGLPGYMVKADDEDAGLVDEHDVGERVK